MTNSSFKEFKYQVARFFFAFLFLCLLCSSPRGHHLRMKAEPQKLPDEREIDTSHTFFFFFYIRTPSLQTSPQIKAEKKATLINALECCAETRTFANSPIPSHRHGIGKKKKDSNENVCRGSRSRYNALTEKKKKKVPRKGALPTKHETTPPAMRGPSV